MTRYGGRATSDQCPAAVILMSVQSIVGVIIEVVTSYNKKYLTLQGPAADKKSDMLYSSLWTAYDGLKQLQNSLYFSITI